METERICPNCRKPLPADVPLELCPECLIKSGFPTETEPDKGGIGRFVPPPVEEIGRLFPQYEILGFIGKGGMGAVYKARQPALDRLVALKVLPPAVASDPGFAERFNREARALARLSHPNIVVVYDFGTVVQAFSASETGTTPVPLHYLVMEFVDGTNLREVERAGRLSAEQALAIVPQICEALQFAHNEGIVHRDIKPENLLIDKKGRVKIADFGIAKILDVPAGKAALTGAKDVVGTPHYMAPEQIEKPQLVDHRADIYSLGVVFYEMLTGELPLGKFSPPSKKVQVDVRLDEVVLHTLEKEPERRYQKASQIKTDVETITGTAPVMGAAARPGGAPPVMPEPVSDKILLPTFLLAFFFGIFGAHRFYVGKIGTGVLQLFTAGGFGIWLTIDWILILCKVFTDGKGRRITNWWHPHVGPPKPPKPPRPTRPQTPPVISGNLFGETFGGTAPMIVAPAVALMIAGFIKVFGLLLILVIGWPWSGVGLFLVSHAGIFSPVHDGPLFGVGNVLFAGGPAAVMIYGATEMIRCRSYAWSIAASLVGIAFCGTLGLPAGIWALIILLLPSVRARFEDAPVELVRETWLKILGGAGAAGLLIFLIMSLAGVVENHRHAAAWPAPEVTVEQHQDQAQTAPAARTLPATATLPAAPAPPAVPAPPAAPAPPALPVSDPAKPDKQPPASPALASLPSNIETIVNAEVASSLAVLPTNIETIVNSAVTPALATLPSTIETTVNAAVQQMPTSPTWSAPPYALTVENKTLLDLELKQAQTALTNVEALFKEGKATSADVDSAKESVDILQAISAGDITQAVQIAKDKLADAQREREAKWQLEKAGQASGDDLKRADDALSAAQLHMAMAEGAMEKAKASAEASADSAAVQAKMAADVSNSVEQAMSHTVLLDRIGEKTSSFNAFETGPAGKLTMDVDRGDVRITAGDGVMVTVHVTRNVTGASGSEAAKILKDENVVLKQDGNDITITAQNPKELQHRSLFNHRNLNAHYEITLPRQFDGQVKTMGGNVDVSGIQGGADLKTMGGNMVCNDIGGDIIAHTMGGQVRVESCKGRLDLGTMGGNIAIQDFTGPGVQATTSGGSVSANFAASPTTDSKLQTMGGNIAVRLPENAALTLEGHTMGGSVTSDFLVEIKHHFGNDTISGAIHGGGPVLEMETQGGNLEVRKLTN